MRISDWSSDVCSSDLLFIDILRDFKIVQGSYSLSMVVRQGDQLIFPGSGICELLMTCSLFLVGHNHHTYGVFITRDPPACPIRSEEHTSELQSLMRISYAVFCLKKKKKLHTSQHIPT